MSRRERLVLRGATPVNPGRRSGIFALYGDPEDDNSIGGATFTKLWRGIEDADNVASITPSPTLLTPFYYDDLMPYSWR